MSQVKKIKKYSVEDMQHAVDAVHRGVSVAAASKEYKVPRITLLYKAKGKYAVDCRMGPETTLTSTEEDLLVKWLLSLASAGFPATRIQLLDSVQILMKKLNRPNKFRDNRPGKKWFRCFLRRHPQLSERLTQNLTKSRSEVTEEKLRKWFDEIKEYIKSKNLDDVFDDERRIFNTDETAFFLNPKGLKCLIRKGDKTAYNLVNNDDKECLTTLITANAAGMLVPPMILFRYERIPTYISSLMPQGWGIGKSESGWMTGQSFYEFIANVFHPWLISNAINFPVVLFVDGHSSHLTMELSNYCVENHIELIALFPNATHILQPMDVAVFHPLKNGWKKGVQKYKLQNEGRTLRREHFGPVLKDVLENSINPDIIKNGFKTCGLFPLDANGIPYHKYFKTTENINCEPNIDKKYQVTTKIIEFLEHHIGAEKINNFKESNEQWCGDIRDTSLYLFWSKLTSEIRTNNFDNSVHPLDLSSQTENCIGTSNKVITVSRLEEDAINPSPLQQKTPEKKPIVILSNVTLKPPKLETNTNLPSSSTVTIVNKPSTSKVSANDLIDVPSPFKSTLFWPKPIVSSRSRRIKEKFPSVATSDQWRAYHKRKLEDKERKEREKEERKKRREEIRKEKMINKIEKTRKQKKTAEQIEEEISSNSSVEVILESEGEGDDWDQYSNSSFENSSSQMEEYVIVKYDDSYYPGKIIQRKEDGTEYKVSTMIKSGILDWKWPEHEDVMWYGKDELIKHIKSPTAKNQRGIFSIPEMKGYSSIFYKF